MLMMCVGMGAWGEGWTRCTSVSDLTSGGTFIIGYEETANSGKIIPMKNTGGTATTSTAGYMASDSEIDMSTVTNTTDYEFTVVASTTVDNAICIKVGDNFIGNTNTKNNCKLFAEESKTTSFGVTKGDNDVFTLKIAKNTDYNTLQYNTSSPRFAVYGNTMKNLVFYKKTGGSTPEPTKHDVTIVSDIANGTITANPTSAAEGTTVALTATPDAGYELASWNVTNASTDESITVFDNKFTMPAADVNVIATFNKIQDKTIAEFIASEGGKCYLTGVVSNIAANNYGNFDLTDETGTIYVYGCLTPAGEKQKFNTLDVVIGDKIKVLAETYEFYSEMHEAVNVIFVEEIAIEKAQYTVTIETPENGTLVVKEGETTVASGDKIEEGKTLTIECNPTDAENFRYKNWQYKEDGNWVTMTTTMTRLVTKDIVIRANFEEIPVYTITWSVNGSIAKSEEIKDGEAVTAPEVVVPEGKVFCGWTNTEIDGTTNDVPQFVTPSATAFSDVIYYAVFATKVSEGTNGTIELTNADIASVYDSKSTSYKVGTIGDWEFKGAINKTSDTYYVQMNRETDKDKNTYNSHLSTPICPAPIKSVTISTTYSTANGRTFILTNSAEVGAASTTGSGVYGYGSLTEVQGSVTIDVSGNPTSLHIYPHGGAVYVSSVVINYGTPSTYLDYCTLVPLSTITLNASGYATFSYASDVEISGANVYTAKIDEDKIVCTKVEGNKVPAYNGVLLYGEPNATVSILPTDDAPALSDDNALKATTVGGGLAESVPAYVLSGDTFKNYTGTSFTENKAYFVKSDIQQAKVISILMEESTSINLVKEIGANAPAYNLQGVRVAPSAKGFVIINGKKFYNK